MEWGAFKEKSGKNESFFFKWRQILSAIPREWKEIIERERDVRQVGIVVPEPHLQVISRSLNLPRLNGKGIYVILIDKMWEKPTSESKIEQILERTDLNW